MPRRTSLIDWDTLLSHQTTSRLYQWLSGALHCQLHIYSSNGALLWPQHTITAQAPQECHEISTLVPQKYCGGVLLQGVFLKQSCCAVLALQAPQDSNQREHMMHAELLSALGGLLSETLARGEGFCAPESRWKSLYPRLIGKSHGMQTLFALLDKISGAELTVLIQGENGSGKELVARTIHETSPRCNGPFVAQNCSALHDNLLDSELFGHKRGSFTGAVRDKEGLFATADGGTFFLDEIGEMSPQLQAKLLRVLETKSFFPVGSNVPRSVDVRVIAATHRDLREMVREGSFREDLFYRLHVVGVMLPPLRERREDIPLLARYFLRTLALRNKNIIEKYLAETCMKQLLQYQWPGNVRELAHELERLWVLSGSREEITSELLSAKIREAQPKPHRQQTLAEAFEQVERQLMQESLRRHKGNKSKAAAELAVSRRNFTRRCQALQLDKKAI
jgi:two-component system response regulator HupR/HoxA